MNSRDPQNSTGEERASAGGVRLRTLWLRLLSEQFKQHRTRLLFGFVALISVDFLQLFIPLIVKQAIDSLTAGTGTMVHLLHISAMIVGIAGTVVVLRYVWRRLLIGFSRYLERSLRNRIFSHILAMDQYFFSRRTTGDIMAHGSNDLAAVQMACGMGMVAAVDAIVLSLAAVGFMIHIHPTLTLYALLPLPLLAVATRILSARLHHRFNHVQEQFSLLTEFARSAVVSVKLIKAYTFEQHQIDRFGRMGETYIHANIRVAMINGLLFPVSSLIGNCGLLIILVFGGRLVIDGAITLGDFAAFTTYLQMLIWPMMAVGWVANLTQRGITALRRIDDLITAEPILVDAPANPLLLPGTGKFRAENLTFSYPGSTIKQLDHVSFAVDSGIIGITGATGSGKTTLCKLLLRLYPVDDGSLFFGDLDVNRLSVDQIRSQISYVSQEPVLFSDTVSANIGFGADDVSLETIKAAAEDADIHQEILDFNNGYDTVIGERGITLSGGQRQRIALARALVAERPILVIDDGLSAVDTSTENRIIEALRKRFENKTVFIVSNRIKLLSMTDRILILETGRLMADAPHETLLRTNSFYQSIHRKQMQEAGTNA